MIRGIIAATVCASAVGSACRFSLAQFVAAPATTVTSQPSHAPTVSASQIRLYLDRLADRDAGVRDHAAQDLMGLSFDDLPTLRNVIKESLPLRPSQAAVLREIVNHVFISGQPYPRDEGKPFLGVGWNGIQEPVVVTRRYPGFPAYRMLRDGDQIQGIKERPGQPLPDTNVFTNVILTFRAGQTITFEVVRDGRQIQVPVTLGTKPAFTEAEQLGAWETEQQVAADEYWDKTFAPLVGDTLS